MARAKTIQSLNPTWLRFAIRSLAERDSALKQVFEEQGYPQMWDRPPAAFSGDSIGGQRLKSWGK